jgi:hypothetical protein
MAIKMLLCFWLKFQLVTARAIDRTHTNMSVACSIEKDRVLATRVGVSYVEKWLCAKYEKST